MHVKDDFKAYFPQFDTCCMKRQKIVILLTEIYTGNLKLFDPSQNNKYYACLNVLRKYVCWKNHNLGFILPILGSKCNSNFFSKKFVERLSLKDDIQKKEKKCFFF